VQKLTFRIVGKFTGVWKVVTMWYNGGYTQKFRRTFQWFLRIIGKTAIRNYRHHNMEWEVILCRQHYSWRKRRMAMKFSAKPQQTGEINTNSNYRDSTNLYRDLALQCCHLANTGKLLLFHWKYVTGKKNLCKIGEGSSDGHQNLITWYFGHASALQKFHQNAFTTFLINSWQTSKEKDRQTWKHYLVLWRR